MSKGMTMALILSVIFAVGAPLANALNMAEKFKKYPSFRVNIAPYDPRDLFYGHYLMFRTDWNFKNAPPQEDARFRGGGAARDACLCVEDQPVNPPVSIVECPATPGDLPSCRHILKGEARGNWNFDNGINRYYLDETIAKPLENLFVHAQKKFSLDIHVSPDGKSLPGMLYVEDIPLKDYIQTNGGKVPGVESTDRP